MCSRRFTVDARSPYRDCAVLAEMCILSLELEVAFDKGEGPYHALLLETFPIMSRVYVIVTDHPPLAGVLARMGRLGRCDLAAFLEDGMLRVRPEWVDRRVPPQYRPSDDKFADWT